MQTISEQPECLQIVPLTHKKWLAESRDARRDRSAVQLNSFTVRILRRHAWVYFGHYIVAPDAARCQSPATHYRFDDCAAQENFSLLAAASFDSFYL